MSKKTIYLDDAIDAVGSMLRRKFGIGGDLAEITLAGLPSAQFEPNCEGCKHQPRFSHEEPCCTCACNYENKYKG